ncbi:hypothetical protein SprV_0902691300 [Sparganum proliferum]
MTKYWTGHFRNVLNRPSIIPAVATNRLPKWKLTFDLDFSPLHPETIRGLHQLSDGKSPGSDATAAEVYKNGVLDCWISLKRYSRRYGVKDNFFKALRIDSRLSPRVEESQQLYDNHRVILLLKIVGRIFNCLPRNRSIGHPEARTAPGRPMWIPTTPWNH